MRKVVSFSIVIYEGDCQKLILFLFFQSSSLVVETHKERPQEGEDITIAT